MRTTLKKFSYNIEGIDQMVEFLKWQLISEWLEKYKFNQADNSAIFLAWAPGAGKTEFIKSILDSSEGKNFVVLDTDTYRSLFVWYNWSNASEFQQLASRVMDKMYSFCMKEGLRVIIDWTFAANKKKIDENIAQCLKRKRYFTIVLIYQDPIISYLYTKIRELEKMRNIPTTEFVRKYFESIENVFRIAHTYPIANIQLVLKKRNGTPSEKVYDNIRTKDKFYTMLEDELDDSERIDRGEAIEYTELELREKMLVLDEFMSRLKEDPDFAKEIAEIKLNYDTNER